MDDRQEDTRDTIPIRLHVNNDAPRLLLRTDPPADCCPWRCRLTQVGKICRVSHHSQASALARGFDWAALTAHAWIMAGRSGRSAYTVAARLPEGVGSIEANQIAARLQRNLRVIRKGRAGLDIDARGRLHAFDRNYHFAPHWHLAVVAGAGITLDAVIAATKAAWLRAGGASGDVLGQVVADPVGHAHYLGRTRNATRVAAGLDPVGPVEVFHQGIATLLSVGRPLPTGGEHGARRRLRLPVWRRDLPKWLTTPAA